MYVENINNKKLYLKIEIMIMEMYVSLCREKNDSRNKNEILTEWIKNHSAEFRKSWCECEC